MRILWLSILLTLGCSKDAALEPDLSPAPDLAAAKDLGESGDLAPASDLAEAIDLGKSADLARSAGDMATTPPITATPIWIGSGGSPSSTLSLCVGGFEVVGETAAPSGAHFSGGFCSFQIY